MVDLRANWGNTNGFSVTVISKLPSRSIHVPFTPFPENVPSSPERVNVTPCFCASTFSISKVGTEPSARRNVILNGISHSRLFFVLNPECPFYFYGRGMLKKPILAEKRKSGGV